MERFAYDRDEQAVGIVHFGIGAFHRAHQAWYTDRAMDGGDRDWGIAGVSLRSAAVAEQMNPQDGLYTVTERSAQGSRTRLIGSVREVLVASRQAASLAIALIAPQTRIVTFTVTEKGYGRTASGSLDLALADQGSFYPILADAMRKRRDAGIEGLTLLSCDNLSGNGEQLQRLMHEYLAARAPDLLGWFDSECRCPSSMVDRIVPATTEDDRGTVATAVGLEDEAAVLTEPFSQWVIEDSFAGPRPTWEKVGAQIATDVAPYETAKLRMLNGAHSALAYVGIERGHTFVHEAMADADIRSLIDTLMRKEAATSFVPAPGQDLDRYASDLISRFDNPALQHRLLQIAMDGSQKIPQRWLATLAAHRARGETCPAILSALGAWMRHVRGNGHVVDDPMAGPLKSAWESAGHEGIVDALFGPSGLIASDWRPDDAVRPLLDLAG
ncbi:MAG: mannitol dehydrogenase family protein [Novosphingobium sp.]|nr:mannitol dehydrogenase family protein [Novosphingobium sp.]